MEISQLKICHRCHTPHYYNCPKCFGFGYKRFGAIVTADESYNVMVDETADKSEYTACPFCGSTITGIPEREHGK
jgi:hypothetical protein